MTAKMIINKLGTLILIAMILGEKATVLAPIGNV